MSLMALDTTLSGGTHTPLELDPTAWFTPKYGISFALLVTSLVGVAWLQLIGKKTPKLVPGLYIVGGSSKTEIENTKSKFRFSSKELIFDGYRQTEGKEPYYVPSEQGVRMVIPTRFMEELKSAPMDKVDFAGVVQEIFEGKHTGMGTRSRMVPGTLSSHLTPHLGSIMPEVQDEIKVATSFLLATTGPNSISCIS